MEPLLTGFAFLVGVVLAHFAFVFLKAFQQRNVMSADYLWIVLTTFGIALVEVYVVSAIASAGFSIAMVLAVGLGGALGATLSVWTHTKYFTRKG